MTYQNKPQESRDSTASELTCLLADDFFGTKTLKDGMRIKRTAWYLPALWGSCFLLQEKKGWFWVTRSWVYVKEIRTHPNWYIEHWLRWDYENHG